MWKGRRRLAQRVRCENNFHTIAGLAFRFVYKGTAEMAGKRVDPKNVLLLDASDTSRRGGYR